MKIMGPGHINYRKDWRPWNLRSWASPYLNMIVSCSPCHVWRGWTYLIRWDCDIAYLCLERVFSTLRTTNVQMHLNYLSVRLRTLKIKDLSIVSKVKKIRTNNAQCHSSVDKMWLCTRLVRTVPAWRLHCRWGAQIPIHKKIFLKKQLLAKVFLIQTKKSPNVCESLQLF